MTISEVSEKYGMTRDTLRYYERVGLIPPVPRKPSGVRDYDEHSCGWVEFIRCMRGAGLSVEVLIEYVRLWQEGSGTREARKHLLTEELHRLDSRISEMKEIRTRLKSKIAHYENVNEAAEGL